MRRTIAVAGAHGKTTTSSMIAHVLLRLRPGSRLPDRRRAAHHGRQRAVGQRALAGRRGRRVRPLVAGARGRDRRGHQRRARPPSSAGPRWSELRDAFRAFLARPRHAVVWDRPELTELRGDRPLVAFEPHGRDAAPRAARASPGAASASAGACPASHNARNATAALEAAGWPGCRRATPRRRCATFAGAGRRFERVGHTASGRAGRRRLRPPPDRGARRRSRRRARCPNRGAWWRSSSRTCTRARSSWPREFADALAGADAAYVVDVYPARERAEDFPGVGAATIAAMRPDRVRDVGHVRGGP